MEMARILMRTSEGPGDGRGAVVRVRLLRPFWEVVHCLIVVGRDILGE
jgi:hypothetical protein